MEYIEKENGLKYRDLVEGTGKEAHKTSIVEVHYTGWLQNADGSIGEKIDSSKDRNRPFCFPMGTSYVIPGWDKGIIGMKEGGVRELVIPPMLAYGVNGAGDKVPPNSTLVFHIELLEA